MKIKYLITFLMVVVFAYSSLAQNKAQHFKDVVYLVNNQKMKGHILEYKIGDYLKLQLKNGRIFTIKNELIKKVDFYNPKVTAVTYYNNDVDASVAQEKYVFKDHGLIINFYFNFLPGKGNSTYYYYRFRRFSANRTGYSLNIGVGYRFNYKFSLGGGISVGTYGFGLDEYFLPMYVSATSILRNSKYSPFIELKAGYGFILATSPDVLDSKGGLYLHPVFGMKISSQSAIDYLIGIGYNYQKAYFEHGDIDINGNVLPPIYHHDITFNRITIVVGLYF